MTFYMQVLARMSWMVVQTAILLIIVRWLALVLLVLL